MDTKQVIKHSSAIQISNKITLLQRKMYNVLLANAYDDLPKKDVYEIEVSKLCSILGFGRNTAHLKDSLEALVSTTVKWNILERDKNQIWGAAALLSQVKIENGICSYAYPPWIRQQLYNPQIYARINLSLQNKFDSKHTLALYELCLDYFRSDAGIGETPWISLDDIRIIFNLKDDTYNEFKFLNSHVIKKATSEINKKSEIYIEDPERKKSGRKVTGLKFKIRPNKRKKDFIKNSEFKSKNLNNDLYEKLVNKYNISEIVAKTIIKTRTPDWIEKHLSEIDQKFKNGNIEKSKIGGYTATVLQKAAYPDPNLESEKIKRKEATPIVSPGMHVQFKDKIYKIDEDGYIFFDEEKAALGLGHIADHIKNGSMKIINN